MKIFISVQDERKQNHHSLGEKYLKYLAPLNKSPEHAPSKQRIFFWSWHVEKNLIEINEV